ncbi:unnamed protein product [Caenorhabditis brenneri]
MLVLIYNAINNYFLVQDVDCMNTLTLFKTASYLIPMVLSEITKRLSVWLCILLATVRLLIVKSTINPNLNRVSKPSFGLKLSLVALLLSILVSLFYFGRIRIVKNDEPWMPADYCEGFPANHTETQYLTVFTSFLMMNSETSSQVFLIFDGVLKTASAVLLPILTILLIFELKVARQKISIAQLRNPSESSKSDNTTRLVVLMTITFMIADGPIGVVSLAQGILIEHQLMAHL